MTMIIENLRRCVGALAAAAVAATLGVTGCGDDEGSGDRAADAAAMVEGTLVGEVEASNAYIALISDGERVAGYLCDGKRVSSWLAPAAIESDSAELRTRDGERIGEVALAGEGASGEVELAGETHAFETTPATGEAGLYRAAAGRPGEPGSVEVGWIVLANGSVRGAKNGFTTSDTDFVVQPAPKFIDSESNLAVDLGAGTGTTEVQKLDAGFIDSESDL